MTPKVTILMPVFNRERLVDEAIRSVIAQDYDDYELLIVDDASSDGVPALLVEWKKRDARIVVVTSPANLGVSAVVNLGLAHARGRYVARFDGDDLMMPRRLAEQAALLDARPDVALASSYYDITDLAGTYLRTWKGDEPHEVMRFLLNFYNAVGGHGQVMYRTDDVRDLGGYNDELAGCEDYDLWVRLLQRGRIETLPLLGMMKRTHDNQAHKVYAGVKRAHWTRIMRSSLEPFLERAVSDEEIAALITVWRFDGQRGKASIADAVMREAFACFRREVSDPALQRCARMRIVSQWTHGARFFASKGHALEAARYLLRAARWRVTR